MRSTLTHQECSRPSFGQLFVHDGARLNFMPRIPQPVQVVACLLAGLGLGLAFPQNAIVLAIAQSGTWFPRTIVTLATESSSS